MPVRKQLFEVRRDVSVVERKMRKKHDVLIANALQVRAPVKEGQVILRPFLEEGISLVATQEVDPASAEKHGTTGD